MRMLIPLVVVLLVGGGLYLLLGAGDDGGLRRDVERAEEEDALAPHLRPVPRRVLEERERARRAQESREARRAADREGETPGDARVVLRGRVVAEETGEGIAGARLRVTAHIEPCPRLLEPEDFDLSPGGASFDPFAGTDEEGAFELAAVDWPADHPPPIDVFVHAPGRVPVVLCAPPLDEAAEVRMTKGLVLEGRALTEGGQAISGVVVSARPGPETPRTPGHAAAPLRTNEEGRYRFDTFLPGEILVDADHPFYMPATWGPLDPATRRTLDLVLQPALVAAFQIRTDDGREAENVTLTWEAPRGIREPQALLLPAQPAEPDAADPTARLYGPVRLPAGEGPLNLVLRADGYAPWRHGPFTPPAKGGEKTFEVDLAGDRNTGTVRIGLEDEQGQPVHAGQANVQVALMALDPGATSAAFVVLPAETLEISALPAGRYRLRLVSAAFAPLETDLEVVAGRETARTLRVLPPAKLRVRFYAPRRMLVRFRLTRDGQEVTAVPENVTAAGEGAVLVAGEEGLLLSGLGTGAYTVEVTSEEVTAPPTTVRLLQGETEEVEISVSDR